VPRPGETRERFCVLCGGTSCDHWRKYYAYPYTHYRWHPEWSLCEVCRVHHKCDVLALISWCFGGTSTVYEDYPGGGGCVRPVKIPEWVHG
jgi:hypothetical protein